MFADIFLRTCNYRTTYLHYIFCNNKKIIKIRDCKSGKKMGSLKQARRFLDWNIIDLSFLRKHFNWSENLCDNKW